MSQPDKGEGAWGLTGIIPRELIKHLEWNPGQDPSNWGGHQYAPPAASASRTRGRSANGAMKTKIVISTICVVLAAAHLIWPDVKVDLATLVLLVAAILPWLAAVIRSVELPGVFKIELQDVKAATEKVTGSVAVSAAQPAKVLGGGNVEFLRKVAGTNPNLALVGLRIEIERRLSQLAELAQIPSDRRSAGAILRDLMAREKIDRQTAAGLGELIALGNQAAHGVAVSPDAAAWALDTSPLILELLDSLIERKSNDRETG